MPAAFRSYASHHTAHYASLTAAGCEQDGEPHFLLRAQDRHAPVALRAWADSVANPEVKAEALRIADAMERWPNRKEPD